MPLDSFCHKASNNIIHSFDVTSQLEFIQLAYFLLVNVIYDYQYGRTQHYFKLY